MRGTIAVALAAAVIAAAPLAAQNAQAAEPEAGIWNLSGLRTAFCVQLLMDPSSAPMRDLPDSYHPVPASEVRDLHLSLRDVIEGQPEFASWSPSRVCVVAVDTVSTKDYVYGDRSGKHPQLFGVWTVAASGPSGMPGEVALSLFSNSGRLIRSAHIVGQSVDDARLTMGKVPAVDEDGVPSQDDRFQVKVGKSTLTWDGRPARDSVAVSRAVQAAWAVDQGHGKLGTGGLVLTPPYSRPMVGSLKVEGKGELAKALRASPTRFAGPAYTRGAGKVTLAH